MYDIPGFYALHKGLMYDFGSIYIFEYNWTSLLTMQYFINIIHICIMFSDSFIGGTSLNTHTTYVHIVENVSV